MTHNFQTMYRAKVAHRKLIRMLKDSIRKFYDPSSESFYYLNIATGKVSYEKPSLFKEGLDIDEAIYPPPRRS